MNQRPVESQQQRVHQAGGGCDLTVGHISLRRSVGRSKLHLCRVMARCQCCHLVSHELMPPKAAVTTLSSLFSCMSSDMVSPVTATCFMFYVFVVVFFF